MYKIYVIWILILISTFVTYYSIRWNQETRHIFNSISNGSNISNKKSYNKRVTLERLILLLAENAARPPIKNVNLTCLPNIIK